VLEEGSKISEKQLGRKIGRHAADFGLDPATPAHRAQLRHLIEEIRTSPDRVVEGTFRGQGAVKFFIKGEDVVVTTRTDDFVTILKGGIYNPYCTEGVRHIMSTKHSLQEQLQEKLGKAIGHALRKIIASVHLFGAEGLSDAPLGLWFFFETLPVFRLTGAPDGWSLLIDGILPEPTDLGESGEIILRDISHRSGFGKVIGQDLCSMWSVQSPPEGKIIGMRFDFGRPGKLLVLNWGDELYMAEQYPDDARDGEIREVPIMPVA
jgi:hypothetical protein